MQRKNIQVTELPITYYLLKGGFIYILLLLTIGYSFLRNTNLHNVAFIESLPVTKAFLQLSALAAGVIAGIMAFIPYVRGNPHGNVRWMTMFKIVEVYADNVPHLFIESRDSRPIYSFPVAGKTNEEIANVVESLREYGVDPYNSAYVQDQIRSPISMKYVEDNVFKKRKKVQKGREERYIVKKRIGPFRNPYAIDTIATADELWADVYLKGHRTVSSQALVGRTSKRELKILSYAVTDFDKRILDTPLREFLLFSKDTLERVKKYLEDRDRLLLRYSRAFAIIASLLFLVAFFLPSPA